MNRRTKRQVHKSMTKQFMNYNKLKQVLTTLFTSPDDILLLEPYADGRKKILIFQAGLVKRSIRIHPKDQGTVKKHIENLRLMSYTPEPRSMEEMYEEMNQKILDAKPLHPKDEEE